MLGSERLEFDVSFVFVSLNRNFRLLCKNYARELRGRYVYRRKKTWQHGGNCVWPRAGGLVDGRVERPEGRAGGVYHGDPPSDFSEPSPSLPPPSPHPVTVVAQLAVIAGTVSAALGDHFSSIKPRTAVGLMTGRGRSNCAHQSLLRARPSA